MKTGKFTKHLRQSYDLSLDKIVQSPFKCLKTTGLKFTDRPIALRFILRYVISSSYEVTTSQLTMHLTINFKIRSVNLDPG